MRREILEPLAQHLYIRLLGRAEEWKRLSDACGFRTIKLTDSQACLLSDLLSSAASPLIMATRHYSDKDFLLAFLPFEI